MVVVGDRAVRVVVAVDQGGGDGGCAQAVRVACGVLAPLCVTVQLCVMPSLRVLLVLVTVLLRVMTPCGVTSPPSALAAGGRRRDGVLLRVRVAAETRGCGARQCPDGEQPGEETVTRGVHGADSPSGGRWRQIAARRRRARGGSR